MKNIEYIIVGDGFAGLFFAHQLIKNNIPFVLFSKGEKSASQVSAGMVNPVVLKKFNTFDNSKNQIDTLKNTLSEIEKYTKKNTLIEDPIHRVFHDEREKETWLKKSENENLKPFLNPNFTTIEEINNPFGCGIVNQSFRVNVPLFFESFFNYLENNSFLVKNPFNHSELDIENGVYQDYTFSKIVFAEGISVRENPFFSHIPIIVNKGHHIRIKIEGFTENKTIKKKHFLFPNDDVNYYYGGTYDRENETTQIDDTAVSQLENGLKEITQNPYEITNVEYGFRPTTKDRKPIIGSHENHKNLFVFNGLGARGLLNGAYYSKALFEHIENGNPLPEEVKLMR